MKKNVFRIGLVSIVITFYIISTFLMIKTFREKEPSRRDNHIYKHQFSDSLLPYENEEEQQDVENDIYEENVEEIIFKQ